MSRRILRLGVFVEGMAIVAAIALAFWIGAAWSPMQVTVSMMMTAIIVLIMLYLFGKALKKGNRTAWASYLVSLGIFGTFLGITVALLSFDTGAVEESVPDLLSGMQIAFISSAVGILLSLILRWKSVTETVSGAADEKTAADVYAVLKHQTSLLESLETALVGDGDTTLITQLKLLREQSKDDAERIRKSLDQFAGTLSEDDSAAFKNLEETTEGVKRTADDTVVAIEAALEGLEVEVKETQDQLSRKDQV